METLLIILHVFVAIVLIVAVLLQAGRGGGMGAAFGGASQQIFGGRGAGTFLAKVTTAMAVIFFLTSLTLSMMSSRERSDVAKALEAQRPAPIEQPLQQAPQSQAPTPGPATQQPATQQDAQTQTPSSQQQQPAAQQPTSPQQQGAQPPASQENAPQPPK